MASERQRGGDTGCQSAGARPGSEGCHNAAVGVFLTESHIPTRPKYRPRRARLALEGQAPRLCNAPAASRLGRLRSLLYREINQSSLEAPSERASITF